LWHKSPEITLIIYGWMFDEAEALCQVEGWFEESEEGGPPQQPPKMKPSNGKTADIGPNWHNPKRRRRREPIRAMFGSPEASLARM
jgi:hypothetical protein